jgi:hypothetical protein
MRAQDLKATADEQAYKKQVDEVTDADPVEKAECLWEETHRRSALILSFANRAGKAAALSGSRVNLIR